MTDDQAKIFGALSRGRLIFPFHDERQALHQAVRDGGLTSREEDRKAVLDGVYSEFERIDHAFHGAMEAGDNEAALGAVAAALEAAVAAVQGDDGA